MKTTSQEYRSLLYQIQNLNRQAVIIPIPTDEPIYEIDLNTRIIHGPSMLSVTNDHNAETIYFKCDRYFDSMDLANTHCIVQYQNANPSEKDAGFIYAVPYIDTTTFASEQKIAFPWVIEGPATAYSGNVTYAIKFYIIDDNGVEFMYALNTAPASGKVLKGMDILRITDNYNFVDPNPIEQLIQRIDNIEIAQTLYWSEV